MSRAHHRLDRKRWSRIRGEILDLNNWRCTTCGGYAHHVDHIVPLHRGGAEYDPDNLQTLCRTCHAEKTRSENSSPDTPGAAEWRAFVWEMISKTP